MIPAGVTLRLLAWPIAAWMLGVQVVAGGIIAWFTWVVPIRVLAFAARLPWRALEYITPGQALGAAVTLTAIVVLCSFSRGRRLAEPEDPEVAHDTSPVETAAGEHRKLANVLRAWIRSQKKARLDHLVRPRAAGTGGFILFLVVWQFPFAVGDWLLGKFWTLAWPRRRMPKLPPRSFGSDGSGDEPPPQPPDSRYDDEEQYDGWRYGRSPG